MSREHSFQALAFPENVPLRTLAAAFPQARRSTLELSVELEGGGTMFLYPFGAVVFQDVDPARRDAQLMVEAMFDRTRRLVDRLERRGTTPLRTGPLHRFIGEAVGTRNEVISVLHLLDKPDAAWDDPAMDAIYEDLRDEFDLGDRYNSLELKLRGIQEALELILDVSRDRRLVLLEVTIVVLIVLELVLSLIRRG